MTQPPEEIRCQFGMHGRNLQDPDRCLNEAEWVVTFRNPECGDGHNRGPHHRYCEKHIWQKLRSIGGGSTNDCADGGHAFQMRALFEGVERL